MYGTLVLEDYWETNDPYKRDGFTLVEENGVLIVRNTIFNVVGQIYDDEFNIVVKDSGMLKVEDGSLIKTDGRHLNIYLYDLAQLYIDASIIDDTVDILAMDNSQVFITDGADVQGDIYANDANTAAHISITNSTLARSLSYIGGSATVELWAVYIEGNPADNTRISVADSGIVYVNWFLTVSVIDVNYAPIEQADVTWVTSPPWSYTETRQTDVDGMIHFWLRGMNITSTGVVKDIGSYKIKSDYTYATTTYYPDSNVSVDMTMNKHKTIQFSSVKPELDPPLYIIPEAPYSAYPLAVNDYVNISTIVYNNGSNDAWNVLVRFKDNYTGVIYSENIELLEAGDS
jgi:hypothetical protein